MRHGGRWSTLIALPACMAMGVAGASVATAPPIPDKPADMLFEGVPAPWRDYFIQARTAERIDDPLQRCSAYPDLPGNRWPTGHAQAHCRHHAIRVLTLTEIDGFLQRGEVAALERVMDGYLAKHFSEDDFGEDIHVAFDAFREDGPDPGRVSADWLALAPGSAYANLARASVLRGEARRARGGEWASKTPRERMRRMSALVEQAIPFYRKAVQANPRLMPAYVGMLHLAMLDSRPDLAAEAVAGARRQDPACLEFANRRMTALSPRWGGSYDEMLSFAAELSRYVERRPHLAVHIAAPYGDRGDRLLIDKAFTRETDRVLGIAVRTGSQESHLRDAANVAMFPNAGEGEADRWRGVALLLQEGRFAETNAWGHRQIASLLVRREPEWSLRHALAAERLDPGDPWGQYLLAAGYYNTRQFEAAERHYLVAAEQERHRQASLRELSGMWMFDAGLEPRQAALKSKPFVDRLLQEYPGDGYGWLTRINVQGALGPVDESLLRTFLARADRNDPRQAEVAERIEQSLSGAAPSKLAP